MERTASGSEADKARRALHRQSRCVMVLPDDLRGRRVLDLECRGGLGVFKIADRVGPDGYVMGADGSQDNIALAVKRAPQMHWAEGEWCEYASFVRARAGGLIDAGLDEGSFDVVVANSSLNLSSDLAGALADVRRVLDDGGFLYLDAVFARRQFDPTLAERFRAADNVFGCAPTRDGFVELLAGAGFGRVLVMDEEPLEPPAADAAPELAEEAFQSATVQAFTA